MNINIYPNPAANVLYIDGFKADHQYIICIRDINGRIIYKKNITGLTIDKIDISIFAPGIYMYDMLNETGLHTYTFIKNYYKNKWKNC